MLVNTSKSFRPLSWPIQVVPLAVAAMSKARLILARAVSTSHRLSYYTSDHIEQYASFDYSEIL
jgi:hypothetical protein